MLTLSLARRRDAQVPPGTLPRDVVRSIGERLLRAAIAVRWTARCRTS